MAETVKLAVKGFKMNIINMPKDLKVNTNIRIYVDNI